MRDDDGYILLHWAAENGCKETVEKLLEKHADPNTSDDFLAIPLARAVENGHEKIVELLLIKGHAKFGFNYFPVISELDQKIG